MGPLTLESLNLCVTAEHADHDALDLAAVGFDDAGLHVLVGRLEADLGALAVEALEGGFAGVEERDDLLAVAALSRRSITT